MTVVRASARATRRGAAENFTGEVFQDEVLVGQAPSRMRATVVSFTPGACTGWSWITPPWNWRGRPARMASGSVTPSAWDGHWTGCRAD